MARWKAPILHWLSLKSKLRWSWALRWQTLSWINQMPGRWLNANVFMHLSFYYAWVGTYFTWNNYLCWSHIFLVAYRLQIRRLIHRHILSLFYVLDEVPFESIFFVVCSTNSVSFVCPNRYVVDSPESIIALQVIFFTTGDREMFAANHHQSFAKSFLGIELIVF